MEDSQADHEITRLIGSFRKGDRRAADELMPLMYQQLRRIAGSLMQRERAGHTLQPTAVVHEAFVRLAQNPDIPADNRNEFKALAAHLMRQVLVDHARRKLAAKRGGEDRRQVELHDDLGMTCQQSEEVLALHQALEALAKLDARQADMVSMAYFAEAPIDEIAEVYDVSPRTVKRELQAGRLFLKERLAGALPDV